MSPASPDPTAPISQFRLGHRPELDGLRGIAILLVLSQHFTPSLTPAGFLGVDLFFVLSGFLITSLLLEEWSRRQTFSIKDFYIRRVLRLAPALLAYLFFLGVYAATRLKPESAREIYVGILFTLAYISNWMLALKPNYPRGIMSITWSLAIEEQFYLIWPLLLRGLLCFKNARRWIPLLLTSAVVLVGVYRGLLFDAGAPIARLYYATDAHADGLLLGCLIACLVCWSLLPQSRSFGLFMKALALAATALVILVVLTVKHNNPILYRGLYSLVSVAIAVTLLTLVTWTPKLAIRLLRFAPLAWIGRISYALYLWHWPLRGFVFGKSDHPSIIRIIVAITLSFAVASLSFYLIERPFLRWKRRFSHA